MKEKFVNKINEAWKNPPSLRTLGIYFLWAFALNLIIETLSRWYANGVVTGGLFGGIVSIFEQPFVFFYGVLLMATMLCLSLLFKRRYIAMVIISVIWIGFGVADFVLLSYRVTPFSVVEFTLIDAAMGIITKYVPIPYIILIIVLLIGVLVLLVYMWKKIPKIENLNRIRSLFLMAIMAGILYGATMLGFATNQLSTSFPNLANAYLDYGFAYCFLNGINMGIHKPEDYSTKKVEEIIAGTSEPDSLETPTTEEPTEEPVVAIEPNMTDPNIIFLQLESFFDITAVEGLQMSADPVPFFRSLKETCSSGFLSVPAIGAGTANTEFEIMTGMNLDFFGPGEYPYKTILERQTCESAAYNLRENGYTAHAIHNNRANFYSRHEIFSQLGYDYFTSIEVMNATEFTPNGWCKDNILTGEIMDSLKATENRDYIYTISVQGHGKYPKEPLIESPTIQLLAGVDDERKYGVEYYINEIYEMDLFLKELVATLENFDEPTILVAYGDHLPGLGFTADDLKEGNMSQTEYVIWSNCDLPKIDEDIEAYQLSSRVLERVGISTGVINAYHQNRKGNDQAYLDDLKILCYDMLYGNMDSTGGENKYIATDLVFGVNNVEVTSVEQDPTDKNYIIVKGNHFTQYSCVMSGEDKLDTEFIDVNTLRAVLPAFDEGDIVPISVWQSYKSKLTLQMSNEITIAPETIEDSDYGEEFSDNNENFE